MDFDCYRIASGSGLSFTVGTSTVAFTLPVSQVSVDAASGRSSWPRYVRVLPEAACYLNFGTTSAVTCGTLVGTLFTPNMPEIICVAGMPYFACIAKTATVVNITPIEV